MPAAVADQQLLEIGSRLETSKRAGAGINSDRVERELTALIQRAEKVRLYGAGMPQLLERAAYRMLGLLYDRGPLRLTDLATEFALDLSTVSRQLATLEKAGLVHRYRDPADQRAYLLAITAAGRQAFERTRGARRQALREILDAWPAGDVDTFAELLERFNAALRARSARPDESAPASRAATLSPPGRRA